MMVVRGPPAVHPRRRP